MGFKRRRLPDPDGLITARLNGAAQRLAVADASEEVAVAELHEIAGGRCDLLAETAGTLLGAHQVDGHPWMAPHAADILIAAGADRAALDRWIEIGRERAQRPRHSW